LRPIRNKIKERAELREIVADLKTQGKKIVFTNGCFDILHRGHVTYLEEARKLGDVLIVGINTDTSVQEIKGGTRPIVSEEERMAVLAALESVDYVVPFAEPDPFELISLLRPDCLVKGGDWNEKDIVGREFVAKSVTVPYVEGASTTRIIETILDRYRPAGDS